MKKYFFLLILFVCGILSAAEKADWKRLSERATLKHFPDADSVLLYDREAAVYQADGKSVTTDECYYKVLTEKGRRELRQLSFGYSSDYEKLEIITLEVIRPDGSVLKPDPAKCVKESISAGQMSSNIYDPDHKQLTVSVPELAVGDILHITWRDTLFKPRIPDVWCNICVMQSDQPILQYIMTVDAPAEMPLKNIVIKDEVPGTITAERSEKDGRILYRWTANNVPQLIPEPDMPPAYTCAQRILMSTVPDWETISRWYYQLCRPRLDAVTPEMKAFTAELIKDAADDMKKMEKIFQFVSQNIRYMGITTEETAPGYEPHDVSMTFENRYGVCRDKAALLTAMLECAGFKAFPALFMAGVPKDPEVANNYFNHAITAVETAPGEYLLMDPTYETTREFLPSSEAEMSYLVARPEGDTLRTSPPAPPLQNLVKITTSAAWDREKEITGESAITMTGMNDQVYRGAFSHWNTEQRKQFFARQLKLAVPGAELLDWSVEPNNIRDVSKPLILKISFRAPVPETAGIFPVEVPSLAKSFSLAWQILGETGLESRKFPMMLYSVCAVEESVQFRLPQGMEPVAMPPEKEEFTSPVLDARSRTSFAKGVLERQENLQLLRTRIMPQEYALLKKQLRAMDTAARSRILFRADGTIAEPRKAFPDANVICKEEDTVLTQLDAKSFREVIRRRELICNYAGVKSRSELKVAYNPVWESVEIRDAKVISPEGKIQPLTDKEINHMDASWNGAAPRYPGGKILVVSFPGVKPGSEVEYTLEKVWRDHPLFAWEKVFPESNPVLQKRLQVSLNGGECATAGGNLREYRNLEAIPVEPGRPDGRYFAPCWGFAAGKRSASAALLHQSLLERTQNQPNAAAKAKSLCAGISDENAKIAAIKEFVETAIRTTAPGHPELPLSALTPADRTLADGYGNSADRAILYKTMLDAVNVPSRFVALHGKEAAPEILAALQSLPDPGEFPEIVVAAGSEKISCYLNAGDRYSPLGASAAERRIGWDLAADHLYPIVVREPTVEKEEFEIRIAPDGSADVTWRHILTGMKTAGAKRFLTELTPEELRRESQKRAAALSQNAVLTGELTADWQKNPAEVTLRVKIPDFAPERNGYRQVLLPGYDALTAPLTTAGHLRKTPFERSRSRTIIRNYAITYPAEWTLLPERDLIAGDDFTRVSLEYRNLPAKKGESLLLMQAKEELSAGILPPEDYGKLIRLQKLLSDPSNALILLKSAK